MVLKAAFDMNKYQRKDGGGEMESKVTKEPVARIGSTESSAFSGNCQRNLNSFVDSFATT